MKISIKPIFLRFCAFVLLLMGIFCLSGCSSQPEPAATDLSSLIAPLTHGSSPTEVESYEAEKYGSAEHATEIYDNGNIACIYGSGSRKYIFSNETLHSLYFYGECSFSITLEQITQAAGTPVAVTGDTYTKWTGAIGGVPVTIVYSKNPVNDANSKLSFEFQN